MNINKIISGLIYKLKDDKRKTVTSKLCGVTLKTTPNTIRSKVDQDDAWFFELAKHNNVIFDIGCNVGYTALLAMIQNPNRYYILVDPNPKALNEANYNLLNNYLGSKAHYFIGFVGDTVNDSLKFYTVGSGAAGSMYASHAKSASSVNSFINVNTVTLDFLYDYYEIKPDLVKIDIEGAESLAMKGAKKMAKETKCKFFVEMHEVENLTMEQAGQFMINWCIEMGYKVWYLKTGEELQLASTIKKRGKCHLLLLPSGDSFPEYLKGIEQGAQLPNKL